MLSSRSRMRCADVPDIARRRRFRRRRATPKTRKKSMAFFTMVWAICFMLVAISNTNETGFLSAEFLVSMGIWPTHCHEMNAMLSDSMFAKQSNSVSMPNAKWISFRDSLRHFKFAAHPRSSNIFLVFLLVLWVRCRAQRCSSWSSLMKAMKLILIEKSHKWRTASLCAVLCLPHAYSISFVQIEEFTELVRMWSRTRNRSRDKLNGIIENGDDETGHPTRVFHSCFAFARRSKWIKRADKWQMTLFHICSQLQCYSIIWIWGIVFAKSHCMPNGLMRANL